MCTSLSIKCKYKKLKSDFSDNAVYAPSFHGTCFECLQIFKFCNSANWEQVVLSCRQSPTKRTWHLNSFKKSQTLQTQSTVQWACLIDAWKHYRGLIGDICIDQTITWFLTGHVLFLEKRILWTDTSFLFGSNMQQTNRTRLVCEKSDRMYRIILNLSPQYRGRRITVKFKQNFFHAKRTAHVNQNLLLNFNDKNETENIFQRFSCIFRPLTHGG